MGQPELAGTGVADPYDLPLETLDVSGAELFRTGAHYRYFERLRAEAPIHYCPDSVHGPYWSVSSYDAVMAVDTNHRDFSSQDNIVIGDVNPDELAPMFIAMDPPKHDVQRLAAQPAVQRPQLAVLEPLIRERVADILDTLPDGEFDWVPTVSREITARMLATLFGIPQEDRYKLIHWSDNATTGEATGNHEVDMEARFQEGLKCLEYFAGHWMDRQAKPPQMDFISLMAHNPHTRTMLQDNPMEFLGNLILLIVGGNDTTRNSISGGVVQFDRNPEEWAKLKADPSLIPNAVSEIIRYQTPLGHMRRTAARDVELMGHSIKKGDRVVMWYVSANRDPSVFTDPDAFRIERDNARRHMSFGFGIHRCMGNKVGEMQLRILWEEVLKRFERIEVVGEPTRTANNFVMGWDSVPVRVHRK